MGNRNKDITKSFRKKEKCIINFGDTEIHESCCQNKKSPEAKLSNWEVLFVYSSPEKYNSGG